MAVLHHRFGVMAEPVFCTKIASKLIRTYTDRHGLKDLIKDLLDIEISKQQQSSDWGAVKLTDQQKHYAASDVLYLHALKAKLDAMLVREGRMAAAEAWGRSQGCEELASDTELANDASAAAHTALGFTEVGRVRCFRKDL